MEKILPHKILVVGWIVWFGFFILSPYSYYGIDPILPGLLLLIFYNLSFFIGLYISKSKLKKSSKNGTKYEINIKKIKRLFILTFILGIVGNALNVYNKISVIGAFSIVNGEENRAAILDSGEFSGNPLAVAAALLYPFSIVSFLLAVFFKKYLSKLQWLLGLIIGVFSSLFLLTLGSRSGFFFFLELSFFAVFLRRSLAGNNKKLITNAQKIRLIIAGCIVLFIFSFIQTQRTNVMGVDSKDIFLMRAEAQQWKYDENSLTGSFIGNNPYELSGILDFVNYYVHGSFEFLRLVNFSKTSYGSLYGEYELFVFVKSVKLIGIDIGTDFTQLTNKYFLHPGIYTTFWGAFFVDFGIWGIALIYFIGRFVKKTFLNFNQGKLSGMLLVPIILAMIFSIPITNAFTGQNTYMLVSVCVSIILYKYIL